LAVTVMSFGFKNGVPRESDMVLDVRFLRNPHWVAKLKSLTGQDKDVQKYIADDDDYGAFMKHTQSMLKLLLPRYADEGKYYFTLAVGCTGGKHRSVYIAETLSKMIKDAGYTLSLRHRDL
ncbi:MAG TPA: RNase adapter RapZ, partial [Alphaproteobacteria bacterium]